MAERIRLPGVGDEENDTANRLLDQLERKALRNRLRASYYDGKRAIRQVGTVIPPQYYRLGLVLGWAAKAVDTLAQRCMLDGFVWPDGDLSAAGADEVWFDNDLGTEISAALTSSLIYGVSFLVVTRGDEGAGESPALVHAKDGLHATGEWDSRRRRMRNLISILDRDGDGRPNELALYLDGVTILAQRGVGGWSAQRSEHSFGVPVEPLVYQQQPRVDRPLGSSRISRTVMSLHDQALRTVIRMEGHADVYSFPEMWMLGADESIFTNADGSPKASWQVMLGRIKGIPDDEEADHPRADVKQFTASSPTPHIDQLKQQAMLFSGETSIPLTSLGVSDQTNPTSADSYIASREDLIAAAQLATARWSGSVQRTMARALAMANREPLNAAQWRSIEAKWRSPVHLSRAAQADAGMKQLGAVPWLAETEVGLELLGLSEQQIKRAMGERRRQVGRGVLEQLTQAASRVTATASPEQLTGEVNGADEQPAP